jgi:hypothetical protein
MSPTLVNLIPDSPVTSLLIWALILIIGFTLIRQHAHKSIRGFCRILRNGLRLAAFSVMRAEKRLNARNREVLLAGGLDAIEREVEREFFRVEKVVDRDLQGYPVLNRKLSEQIEKIDQDYSESKEVPPTPPVWVNAVEAVAKLATKGDSGMVAEILTDIHKTIAKQQKKAMDAYWKGTSRRHEILSKIMPSWRQVAKILERIGSTMSGLEERAKFIDRKMADYEEIRKGTDKAAFKLHSSSSTQFFISGFWLMVAIGGISVNFHLIALPMADIAGGAGYIGNFRVSELAGLFIILVETFIGMALMESLHFTKLFPLISSMDDKKRHYIAWIAFCILLTFAGIESSLAYIRDIIAARNEALTQSLLGGGEAMQVSHSIIATVAQMIMGFILPFALTFAIIPLESFVHSARTVIGYLIEMFLRVLAFLLRLTGNFFYYLGSLVIGIYDIIAFPAMWLENFQTGGGNKSGAPAVDEEPAPATVSDQA